MNTSRLFMALAAIALTSGCAAPGASTPSDPLESFNRGVYQFNDTVDKAIAKPVAQGYDAVMPRPGKVMVSNFFSNLDDVIVTANDLLQLKFHQAASDGSRFLFNSTFGILGLLDVTSRLEKHDEDFGQTLGYWGVGSGPYIVLPILGPSTLRDGVGLYADSRPSKLRRVDHMRTRNQLYITKAISHRAELLEQEKLLDEAVIDRYAFIRDAYLLRRQSLVHDGNPPRRKYDEYDDEEDVRQEQAPIPTVPSSGLEQAPSIRPVSVESKPPAMLPVGPQASSDQSSLDSPRRNILKVWVAQQDAIH
jgi:phospholipid-binding lipoprotein MlaA